MSKIRHDLKMKWYKESRHKKSTFFFVLKYNKWRCNIMPRYRKEPNRYWSKDEKLRIVKKVVDEGYSSVEVARVEDISSGMLREWVQKYLKFGEEVLENKRKPGNPLSKYARKKDLTRTEELEYEVMKLRIENERLKKGYMTKGDGTFVTYKR